MRKSMLGEGFRFVFKSDSKENDCEVKSSEVNIEREHGDKKC